MADWLPVLWHRPAAQGMAEQYPENQKKDRYPAETGIPGGDKILTAALLFYGSPWDVTQRRHGFGYDKE